MKPMPLANDMKNIVEHIVSSYEARVQSIAALFDTTHQILQGFQDSLIDMKQERETFKSELRESLAKNESLRRKDFDNMTKGIILTQDEREKEVRNLLGSYLNEQKEMSQALRKNLEKFEDSLAKGEAQRVKEFQEMIKHILTKQEERKDEVTSRLKEFKKEQKVLTSRLKGLLAKGRDLRIKDLKTMLKEFKAQYKERLVRQEERKKEVRQLLGGLKKGQN
jgi:iron-sulfur cluster repair protein YtfE (RIC family)